MNKRFFLWIAAFLFTAGSMAVGQNVKNLRNWHREEVTHIITKSEAAEYRKLKKDEDRKNFIELFWAKRDPTPSTEKNEFREVYYARLAHVEKTFRYGYNTGSTTDQGKIYLYFGQARILQQSPSAQAAQSLQTDEVWLYPSQPWMNFPKDTYSVVFSHDGVGYTINHTKTDNRVIQAIYKYPETILLHPDLKEIPDYTEISAFEPGSFEAGLIEKVQTAEAETAFLPFENKALFIKAENSSSYMTFLIKIPPTGGLNADKNLFFFGKIESEAFSYSFRREKPLIVEQDYFMSHLGFPIPAGDYTLYLGFYSPDKEISSVKMEKITVPDFWNQSLALSSILASTQVQERVVRVSDEEHDFFTVGAYSLNPQYGQDYGKENFLNIFYYIYNMALDDKDMCSLTIEFEIQYGEQKFQLDPQKRQKKVAEGVILPEGTRIPVSALPAAGEYTLVIKVTDELAKKVATETLSFTVH